VPDRPEPATKAELIADAGDLGLAFAERDIREWHRLGLLGSPERRTRAEGSGTQPGLYSSEQRALFSAIARAKTTGSKNVALARIPVMAWLDFPDGWVDTPQVHRALDTILLAREQAPPPNAKRKPTQMSARAAEANVVRLLAAIDIHGARVGRTKFRNVVTEQLITQRINEPELRSTVAALYEPNGVGIVRGPDGAAMTVDTLTEYITSGIRGLKQYPQLDDQGLRVLRNRHRILYAQYESVRSLWESHAEPDIRGLFEAQDVNARLDSVVSNLLILIGLDAHKKPVP
jgi:hypothetical protein